MDGAETDPRVLLDALRAEQASLAWVPIDPEREVGSSHPRPLLTLESLGYLHHHWALPDAPPPIGRRGLRGWLATRLARFTFAVLQPYLRAERDLLANMTRVHDATAKRVDEIAWDFRRYRIAQAENLAALAAYLDAHQATTRPDAADDGGG